MISGYAGNSDELDEAMVRFAFAYADQTEKDHRALAAAAKSGRSKWPVPDHRYKLITYGTNPNNIQDFSLSEGGPFHSAMMKMRLHNKQGKLTFVCLCATWVSLLR